MSIRNLFESNLIGSVGYENKLTNMNSNNEVHNQAQYEVHPSQLDSRIRSIPSTSIPLPTVPASAAAAAVLAASSPVSNSPPNNQQGNFDQL